MNAITVFLLIICLRNVIVSVNFDLLVLLESVFKNGGKQWDFGGRMCGDFRSNVRKGCSKANPKFSRRIMFLTRVTNLALISSIWEDIRSFQGSWDHALRLKHPYVISIPNCSLCFHTEWLCLCLTPPPAHRKSSE